MSLAEDEDSTTRRDRRKKRIGSVQAAARASFCFARKAGHGSAR
jgi:hypothetical protein